MALIDAIAIVVPVNNEEQSLPACIAGLRSALDHARVSHPDVAVEVRFALDRCSDRSAELIRSAGHSVIESGRPGVGPARAAGVRAALAALALGAERVFIACTDADSVVPAEWLTSQLELAAGGADVIVGPVRPAENDLDSARQRAWELTHRDGQARGHIHGANLGIRASTYLAVGGFSALEEHEDVDLVARAEAVGAIVRSTESHCVVTSGRLHGRTPGGYAGYLRDQLLPLSDALADEQSVA
jgi:glycosyltransferase involved in cell wall biosynthesis